MRFRRLLWFTRLFILETSLSSPHDVALGGHRHAPSQNSPGVLIRRLSTSIISSSKVRCSIEEPLIRDVSHIFWAKVSGKKQQAMIYLWHKFRQSFYALHATHARWWSELPDANYRCFLSWRFLLHSYTIIIVVVIAMPAITIMEKYSKMMITEDACPWAYSEARRHYVWAMPISCHHIPTSKCQAAKARRRGKFLEPQTGSTESRNWKCTRQNFQQIEVKNIEPILVLVDLCK